VLSQLQQEVASVIEGLDQAHGFALAGGGALIVRGEIDRLTRDLDYFALDASAVDRLVPAAIAALAAAGFSVEEITVGTGYARLAVSADDDRTEVDFGVDARLFPTEKRAGHVVLSGEELAVDKLLAVFGRAEARDFADLLVLEPRFGLDHLLSLAAEKDLGFSPQAFASMLGRFQRLGRQEFPIDEPTYEALATAVARWRQEADASRP